MYSTGISGESREKQVKKVLSWQFLYCLKFWSKVVSQPIFQQQIDLTSNPSSNTQDIIGQLVYPVVQICLCVLNVVQKTKQQYFPFFIHIIRLLNEIAIRRNVFVSTFNYAYSNIEMMNSNHALTKSDNLKPIDLSTTFKVSKAFINSRLYFDLLLEECSAVILEGMSVGCISEVLGFIEYGEIIRNKLAKCIKKSKNPKFSKFLGELVEVIKENQSFIQEKRNNPIRNDKPTTNANHL